MHAGETADTGRTWGHTNMDKTSTDDKQRPVRRGVDGRSVPDRRGAGETVSLSVTARSAGGTRRVGVRWTTETQRGSCTPLLSTNFEQPRPGPFVYKYLPVPRGVGLDALDRLSRCWARSLKRKRPTKNRRPLLLFYFRGQKSTLGFG